MLLQPRTEPALCLLSCVQADKNLIRNGCDWHLTKNRSHLLVSRIDHIDHFSSIPVTWIPSILHMRNTASIYQQCESLADFNSKRPRGDKLWKAVAHDFAKYKAY